MGLREQLLARPKPQTAEIDGSTYYIRVMSGRERDAWEAETYHDGEVQRDNARARLLVRCLCDEAGARLFTDAEAEALGQADGTVLAILFTKAWSLNKLGGEAVADSKKG